MVEGLAAMDAFSYVSVLISIVLALGITRILIGIGKLMEKRGQVHIYWVHLMWAINVFLFLTLQWWILFRWEAQQEWTFFLNLFLLASPTIVFLLCVILFPEPIEDDTDFKKHFFNNYRWFFALAALLAPLDFVDTLLKGYQHLMAQGIIYPITIALVTSLSTIAALTDNEGYHKFFSLFFFVYILTFISINLNFLA